MSKQLASHIDIDASPAQVWDVLSDLAAYQEWNPFIVHAEGTAETGSRLTLRMQPTGGRAVTLRPTVLESREGSRLRWLGRLGIPGVLDAEHSFTIEARADGGARLLQDEKFSGLLVPFLARSLDRSTLPGFDAMNQALKRRVEQAVTSGHRRAGRRPGLPRTASPHSDGAATATTLAVTRSGAGTPLVLLPALGLSRHEWDPVIPALAAHFDVLAVDVPGFGDSASLPSQVEPTPVALAAAVAAFLDDLGIVSPHVVGNSLGGWIALELAALRPAASVTLLSPAGLWRGDTPLYCRVSLRASRWVSRHGAGLVSYAVKYRLGRILVLGQTHGRPGGMAPAQARQTIRDLGTCPGFDAALQATLHRRYVSRSTIQAPVTIAFGSRDRLLLRRQSRHLEELPSGTRVGELPGCGHVPVADDPAAVVALITESAARGAPIPRRVG